MNNPVERAQLVIALDLADSTKAIALAKDLSGITPWLKVGLRLFISSGPTLVRELASLGFKIFLDLKFYDIPNTVAAAVEEAAKLGVNMLTVHSQGGEKMCREALKAAGNFKNPPLIAAVTALTSFASGEMPGIEKEPSSFAEELASLAASWKIPAIVCSPLEAANIKKQFPTMKCVCPGIRPANTACCDQRRVATPESAVRAGADFLVVGRPVIDAANPVQAARNILREMRNA